jgi:hypothetical protein
MSYGIMIGSDDAAAQQVSEKRIQMNLAKKRFGQQAPLQVGKRRFMMSLDTTTDRSMNLCTPRESM